MSNRDYKLFLKDILESSEKIIRYMEGKSYEEFIANQMLIDAVIRNLEVIGEAAKNIPDRVIQNYPEIEWRKIKGLRDIIIHSYFRIDSEILWDIVHNKVPQLHSKIGEILRKEEKRCQKK